MILKKGIIVTGSVEEVVTITYGGLSCIDTPMTGVFHAKNAKTVKEQRGDGYIRAMYQLSSFSIFLILRMVVMIFCRRKKAVSLFTT